jgi:hypothetical protein
MPTCFFVLQRLWIRVDDVMFRVIDTRYFHQFGSNHVLREYQLREGTFEQLRTVCRASTARGRSCLSSAWRCSLCALLLLH